MIPFNHIRDPQDIGIRKEQQTAGDDDAIENSALRTSPNERTGRQKIG
jgi:hypothetical protein